MRYPSYYPIKNFVKCIKKLKLPFPNLEAFTNELINKFNIYTTFEDMLFDGEHLQIRENLYVDPIDRDQLLELIANLQKYKSPKSAKLQDFLDYTFPKNGYCFSDNVVIGKFVNAIRFDITSDDIATIKNWNFSVPKGIDPSKIRISEHELWDTEYDDGFVTKGEIFVDIIDEELELEKLLLQN